MTSVNDGRLTGIDHVFVNVLISMVGISHLCISLVIDDAALKVVVLIVLRRKRATVRVSNVLHRINLG